MVWRRRNRRSPAAAAAAAACLQRSVAVLFVSIINYSPRRPLARAVRVIFASPRPATLCQFSGAVDT